MKLIHHFFFYLVNGYPFFSSLEQIYREKETELEKEIAEVLQQPNNRKSKTVRQK